MQTITSKIDFITRHFGEGSISRDGTNFAVQCPECGKSNEKRKFSICLETWRCHCWVCGVKGKNLFKLISKHRGIDYAREYAVKFKIKTDDTLNVECEIKRIKLPHNFMMIASNVHCSDPDFKAVLSYLKHRGVTLQQMWYHKIGTVISGGFWNRRVIFPSFDKDQELTYYVSRSIDDDVLPKYLNSKADKKEVVFDEIRIDWNQEITLVEGVFDLIKCNNNATCLLGSYMSKDHKIFHKIIENKTPVLLALDEDVKAKTHKIADLLFAYNIGVRIMNTSGYDDVGEMSRNEFIKRASEAYNYNGDSKLNFLIERIASGSVF